MTWDILALICTVIVGFKGINWKDLRSNKLIFGIVAISFPLWLTAGIFIAYNQHDYQINSVIIEKRMDSVNNTNSKNEAKAQSRIIQIASEVDSLIKQHKVDSIKLIQCKNFISGNKFKGSMIGDHNTMNNN